MSVWNGIKSNYPVSTGKVKVSPNYKVKFFSVSRCVGQECLWTNSLAVRPLTFLHQAKSSESTWLKSYNHTPFFQGRSWSDSQELSLKKIAELNHHVRLNLLSVRVTHLISLFISKTSASCLVGVNPILFSNLCYDSSFSLCCRTESLSPKAVFSSNWAAPVSHCPPVSTASRSLRLWGVQAWRPTPNITLHNPVNTLAAQWEKPSST